MTKNLNKFILLMWKNWTLLRRRPIQAVFEIVYPVLICLILVGVRSLITVTEEGPKYYDSYAPTINEFCEKSTYVEHEL